MALILRLMVGEDSCSSIEPLCSCIGLITTAIQCRLAYCAQITTSAPLQVPGQRQRPQKKIIPSKGRGRGLAPANRPLQTRQRSGLGVLHSASKSGLERCSSYSKRRRNEYDMADILMSDAKYVERPKVCLPLSCSFCSCMRGVMAMEPLANHSLYAPRSHACGPCGLLFVVGGSRLPLASYRTQRSVRMME